jgi:hypothetical protein
VSYSLQFSPFSLASNEVLTSAILHLGGIGNVPVTAPDPVVTPIDPTKPYTASTFGTHAYSYSGDIQLATGDVFLPVLPDPLGFAIDSGNWTVDYTQVVQNALTSDTAVPTITGNITYGYAFTTNLSIMQGINSVTVHQRQFEFGPNQSLIAGITVNFAETPEPATLPLLLLGTGALLLLASKRLLTRYQK